MGYGKWIAAGMEMPCSSVIFRNRRRMSYLLLSYQAMGELGAMRIPSNIRYEVIEVIRHVPRMKQITIEA